MDFTTAESDFCNILNSATNSTPTKSISLLYDALMNARNVNTWNIKEKWEKEAAIELSGEA